MIGNACILNRSCKKDLMMDGEQAAYPLFSPIYSYLHLSTVVHGSPLESTVVHWSPLESTGLLYGFPFTQKKAPGGAVGLDDRFEKIKAGHNS